jgi:hypothetical protein
MLGMGTVITNRVVSTGLNEKVSNVKELDIWTS